MEVFICHASEDKRVAASIALALRGVGFTVFFDETDLPQGGEYHSRILAAVASADRFVFLISRHSTAPGRYTLSELDFAKAKWPHPKDRVFPVVVSAVDHSTIDPYLLAVSLVEPKGPPAPYVLDVVMKSQARSLWRTFAAVAGIVVLLSVAVYFLTAPGIGPKSAADNASSRRDGISNIGLDNVGPLSALPAPGIERTLTLESGETASIPFSLDTPRDVEVVIKSLTPDWGGFTGQRGAPGQDGVYVRICSSAEAPCREGQLGAMEPFSRSMPAGSGHVALFNFGSSPKMSIVVKIRNVTANDI